MTVISYFVCALLNMYYFLTYRKSKAIPILSLVLFAYVLYANVNVADYSNYLNNYINPQNPVYRVDDTGYVFLISLFKIIGLEYQQFRLFFVVISLLIIYKILNKINCNLHYVFFFYSLYGVIMDAVQFRFYIASILLIAAICLAATYKKEFRVLICVMMGVASTIHTSFILFLVVYLVSNNIEALKRYRKVLMFLVAMVSVIGSVGMKLGLFDSLLGAFVGSSNSYRLSKYFSTRSNYGFIFPLVVHLGFWVALKQTNALMVSEAMSYKKAYVKYLYEFMTVAFVVTPLYVINVNFYRFLRIMIVPILIAFSFGDEKYRTHHKAIGRAKRIMLQIGLTVLCFVFELLYADMIDSIFRPIFGI